MRSLFVVAALIALIACWTGCQRSSPSTGAEASLDSLRTLVNN
jgi:hypothetical protein